MILMLSQKRNYNILRSDIVDQLNKDKMLKAISSFRTVERKLISSYQDGYIGKNVYKVTFVSDGKTLETKDVEYGATITYTGVTPTKDADLTYTYEFSGWNNTLGTVTGEAEFIAQFTPKYIDYTVYVIYEVNQWLRKKKI